MKSVSAKKPLNWNVNNIHLFSHRADKPFISVGIGNADIKMNKGTFAISDNIDFLKPLTEYSLEKDEIIKFYNQDGMYQNVKITKNQDEFQLEFLESSHMFNRYVLNFNAINDERVYGCGEHFAKFNLKGEKVKIWVQEHNDEARTERKHKRHLESMPYEALPFDKYTTYYVQPTFVSSKKYFCHFDTDAYVEFDFTSATHKVELWKKPKSITICAKENFESLLENLSELLGRQPELPDWIYNGMILGIQGGTDIMLEKYNKMLSNNVQVSGIWCQDWEGRRITDFGKQLMWNWKWDEELYPNLPQVIKKLNNENVKFLGYINPFLAIEKEQYKEASEKGYVVKNKNGEDYMVTITTFPAAMIDLTNPKAIEWTKDIIKKNMIDIGLSGWMADFGEYLPVDAVLYSGISGEEIHNKWSALWSQVNKEAIDEAGKSGEIFFFTRAGHTETIKNSVIMWNGDQHVDWSYDEGFPSIIPAMLSLSMSGFGISHSDIGGYITLYHMKRSKELLLRWAELSAFTPVMRTHEGNRPDDNWQFDGDEETIKHFALMTKVYTMLSPYIKDIVVKNHNKGVPAIRPIFFHYDEDNAYDCSYQYLLGRDLLVAPVIEEDKDNWLVYLPQDKWVHIWSGEKYSGGSYSIKAPIGHIPVFYREDSEYKHIFESIRKISSK